MVTHDTHLHVVKTWFLLVLLVLMAGMPQSVHAQTTTADWTNLGLGNFQAVPDGDTLTAGGRTITVNQTSSTDGGTFTPTYSTGFLSYYTGNISTQTGPLLYNFDNSAYDADDKITTTYTFDANVTGLTFRLLDVDRNVNAAQDAVEVYYDTGSGVFQNAANTAAFYTTGTTNSRVSNGYMTGFLGNSSSSLSSTAGDVTINFGATAIKRVRIVYFSGQSQTGDPSGPNQYIGLSDFQYDTPPNADLSLSKTVSNATPANGTAVSYTLSVSNSGASTGTANGVEVTDILPAGFTFASASGTGSYNDVTGIWNVGTVPIGATRSITISGTVDATSGATVTNTAEITASSIVDIDSTVNNGVASEDDYASVSFTVSGTRVAGTPPTLSCPASNTLTDWNARTWVSGTTNNSYTVPNIGSINYALTTDGAFANGAPAITSDNTGGFGATQAGLYQFLEFTNRSQTATTVITLPTAVPALQFVVLDVDFGNNDFADKVTITGSYNGTAVMPTLTNGIANYVVGNTAIGDAGAAGNSADGNVWVTFTSPVDTVTFVYGNHTTAPADPDGQAATLFDFNYCNPETTLSVTKLSSVVSDPANGTTDPKAIPGAVINYCILINNSGSATAENISAVDNLPANITYNPGSLRTGTGCNATPDTEDDDATGADESDPFGASISGTTIGMSATNLGPASTFALTFQATVD